MTLGFKYRTGEPVSLTPPVGVSQEAWVHILRLELERGKIVPTGLLETLWLELWKRP